MWNVVIEVDTRNISQAEEFTKYPTVLLKCGLNLHLLNRKLKKLTDLKWFSPLISTFSVESGKLNDLLIFF